MRFFSLLVLIILLFSIMPAGSILAAEPGEAGGKIWVLTETKAGVPDKVTEWENTFLDMTMKYKVVLKEAHFEFHEKIDKSGKITMDAHFSFDYEVPPEELVPGDTVRLTSNGSVSGLVHTSEQEFIYLAGLYSSDGTVISDLGGQRYLLKSDAEKGSTTLQFMVPEAADGNIRIKARISKGAQYYIEWIYASEESETTGGGSATTSSSRPSWQERAKQYISPDDGEMFTVPDWLQWLRPKDVVRQRGVVIEPHGDIWVYNRAFDKWMGPIKAETTIYSGDLVRTGPNTRCRVIFTNGAEQDAISVGSETLLETPRDIQDSPYPLIWSLYEGAVRIKRAVLRETPEGSQSPFIIRTPGTPGGVRGSLPESNKAYCALDEFTVIGAGAQTVPWAMRPAGPAANEEWNVTGEFIVSVDESATSVYVVTGELDYDVYRPAATGDAALFIGVQGPNETIATSGQKISFTESSTGTATTFTSGELDSLMSDRELDEPELLGTNEVQSLLEEDAEDSGGDSIMVPVIIGVVIVLAVGAAAWFVLARRRARG